MDNFTNDYNYKVLINEFCEEKKISKNDKAFFLKPEIYEKDLFNLLPYELGNLILEISSSKSALSFKQNYLRISTFFEWCSENKYIEVNPYKELEHLSYNNLLYQMAEQSAVTVIYDYELRGYSNRSICNKELCALIVGLSYDGVANLGELTSIRWGQIDLYNRKIKIKEREIPLSAFSIKAIKKYKNVDEYEIQRTDTSIITTGCVQHKDFLLKVTDTYYNPDITDEQFISGKGIGCQKLLKKIGLSYFDVTKSGALNALRKEFKELDNSEFCKIFFKEYLKKLTRKEAAGVRAVMKVYGGRNTSDFVDSLIPFVVKSKYYQSR